MKNETTMIKNVLIQIPFLLCFSLSIIAQEVEITVDASSSEEKMNPIWTYFGHDEPNYTYMPDGKKLLTQLSEISPVPLRVRTHNLLTSDVGVPPNLKWGFTNAYTEDDNGNAIYDWTILDSIFDVYHELNIHPLVEIGFMPKDLSTQPEPYAHNWADYGELWTGWTYPPKDYKKWEELVYQWVKHSIDRYGQQTVENWLWQVWNEPDIGYWSGTFEEYCKLYDFAVNGVKRACENCVVGGPHTTNPDNKRAQDYLKGFIEHCLTGTNYATGEKGSPLEFIAFHAKGNPEKKDDYISMGMARQLNCIDQGFAIINEYPELKGIPVIIGENDPEGCAACSFKRDPKYGYRNGTVYPSYTASSFAKIYELALKHDINLVGALSWAFEFEGQEWYAGFRDLATNGINKAVFNVFKMYSMMGGDFLNAHSSLSKNASEVINNGVKSDPDIGVLATGNEEKVAIMIWNYHDNDLPAPPAKVDLNVTQLPNGTYSVSEYRIDKEHSNSYEKWKELGSPQKVNEEEFKQLEKASKLTLLKESLYQQSGNTYTLDFHLPRQGISLFLFEKQ